MKKNKKYQDFDEPVSINMTSLIDVIFILLIFFMIGSTFEKPVMKVTLPEAETGKTMQVKSIEVTVTKNGEIYVGKEKYEASSLEIFLKQIVEENPEVFVSLSCDESAEFKNFVTVMDTLNKVGVKNATVKHKYPQKQ